jgi:hypothetical protein
LGLFGWEAFAAIREFRPVAGPGLPVVMILGWADEPVITRARAAGGGRVSDPALPEQLLDAVLRVCPDRNC